MAVFQYGNNKRNLTHAVAKTKLSIMIGVEVNISLSVFIDIIISAAKAFESQCI